MGLLIVRDSGTTFSVAMDMPSVQGCCLWAEASYRP